MIGGDKVMLYSGVIPLLFIHLLQNGLFSHPWNLAGTIHTCIIIYIYIYIYMYYNIRYLTHNKIIKINGVKQIQSSLTNVMACH